MGTSDMVMKNKSRLDSLAKFSTDTTKRTEATSLSKELNTADSAMEDWMHKFNPDYTGKSHDQIMEYLQSQQTELLKVDSMISAAVKQSNQYLSTAK